MGGNIFDRYLQTRRMQQPARVSSNIEALRDKPTDAKAMPKSCNIVKSRSNAATGTNLSMLSVFLFHLSRSPKCEPSSYIPSVQDLPSSCHLLTSFGRSVQIGRGDTGKVRILACRGTLKLLAMAIMGNQRPIRNSVARVRLLAFNAVSTYVNCRDDFGARGL